MSAEDLARLAAEMDVPALKSLWKNTFQDDDDDIEYFFDTYFFPEMAAVIGPVGAPVGAAYVLPVGDLMIPGMDARPCAMLYAIATRPECRGLGYGAAATRAAGKIAADAGFTAVVLKPADDGLFGFYQKHSDFREYFDIGEYSFSKNDLKLPSRLLTAAPVPPGEYRTLRRTYLKETVYIDTDERGLAFQNRLCASSGGGLYRLSNRGSPVGCAVIAPNAPTVNIKELLTEDNDLISAVSAVAELFPAESYIVRAPSCSAESLRPCLKSRFGMMVPVDDLEIDALSNSIKWYGPAFD